MNSRQVALTTVSILFLILSLLAVSLRCYVRRFMIKSFGADDWAMVITEVLYIVYVAFVLAGIGSGTGQHMDALTVDQIKIALRDWWCCEIFYITSTAALKVAIGIFLLRIAVKKLQIYILWAMISLATILGAVYLFVVIFQCSPISSFWDLAEESTYKCISPVLLSNLTYVHAAIICVCDITFAVLPILLVWNLHMNKASKASLRFILCLGTVGCIASLIRFKTIDELAASVDFLYASTDLAIWSTVEPGVGITAASLATLRPLFKSILDKAPTRQTTRAASIPMGRSYFPRPGNDPKDGYPVGTSTPHPEDKSIYMTTNIRVSGSWKSEREGNAVVNSSNSSCEGLVNESA